jgi:hypothetical protein
MLILPAMYLRGLMLSHHYFAVTSTEPVAQCWFMYQQKNKLSLVYKTSTPLNYIITVIVKHIGFTKPLFLRKVSLPPQ